MGQWDPRTGTFGNEMNPFIKANQSGIMGLGAYGQNPLIQNGGGQNPKIQVNDYRDKYRQLPPAGWHPQQPTYQQPPPQNPWMSGIGLGGMANIAQIPGQMTGFGEQMGGFGEQMGGFGEQLGGYKDLLSGFGEKFGSFGEQLGGFKDEFTNINDKLQGLEQGISSLTDKFGTQQQQQQQPQQNYMNPFGSINPYTPFFGGLGAFMRRY